MHILKAHQLQQVRTQETCTHLPVTGWVSEGLSLLPKQLSKDSSADYPVTELLFLPLPRCCQTMKTAAKRSSQRWEVIIKLRLMFKDLEGNSLLLFWGCRSYSFNCSAFWSPSLATIWRDNWYFQVLVQAWILKQLDSARMTPTLIAC